MANDLDRAQQDIEFLEQIQSHPEIKLEVEPTGYCLFCGEKIENDPQRRWCSFDCMKMWEREQYQRK